MAIKSTLQVQFPGIKNPIPIQGGFTRIVKFESETYQLGLTRQQVPNPAVKLYCLEWETEEGAQRVYEPTAKAPFEGDPEKYTGLGVLSYEDREEVIPMEFDSENPVHMEQWNKYLENPGPKPPKTPEEVKWSPTIKGLVRYWFEHFLVWNGKYVEEPLRTRILELPLEQAIQVVQMQVPGKNPQENFDRIESQVYRAAMQSGLFINPKIA